MLPRKVGKFGNSDTELLLQDVVEGNAFQLSDLVLEVLEKKYFTSPISYQVLHRVEGSEYPYEAMREILLNAIVHRTYTMASIQISIYSDKLNIWNEGHCCITCLSRILNASILLCRIIQY